MQLKVSEDVLKDTSNCKQGFSCLAGKGDCLCEVEDSSNGMVLFIKPACKSGFCYYRLSFGCSFICNCPVRKEIFNRYNT